MAKLRDGNTHSDDGPECPHCGFTFTPDEQHYYDEMGYTEETCADCHRKFTVKVRTSTTWSCSLKQNEPDAH